MPKKPFATVEDEVLSFLFSCLGKPKTQESILTEVGQIIVGCGWTVQEFRGMKILTPDEWSKVKITG